MLSVVITVKLHDFVNLSKYMYWLNYVQFVIFVDKTPFFIHTFIFLSYLVLKQRSVTVNKTSSN